MTIPRKLLVTSALPYANGHLHIGHFVEHIQTDVWVRVHKMLGIECISICGDDAHGTPIMLKASQEGVSPEEFIAMYQQSHMEDFQAFAVDYDGYYSTHIPEAQALVNEIYEKLCARGDIVKKTIKQAYDLEKSLFLPDRYVKGTCPQCQAKDQYGDNCEACGATYAPTALLEPYSVLSGTTPVEKESEHYFFDLPQYDSFLRSWVQQGTLQKEIVNKLQEWFVAGLQQWDISRDAPYFGFPIPHAVDKYFYVWLDAPIGYLAGFQKYCQSAGTSFSEFWQEDSKTEVYHFVGKDIIYFHALFWPAILSGANYRLPTAIFAHGFLTVEGQKMSKSRHTFIEARTYRKHLHPEYLRYYFASKLNGSVEDIDLQFDDFMHKVNADLIGKVVNIASRSAGFMQKYFQNKLTDTLHNPSLYQTLLSYKPLIIEAYIERDYAKAVRQIMEATFLVNQYIDQEKPWVLAKNQDTLPTVQAICSMGLQLFRILMTYLKPILPIMAQKVEVFLQCEPLTFAAIDTPLLGHTITVFTPLLTRVEKEKIEAMLEEAKVKA